MKPPIIHFDLKTMLPTIRKAFDAGELQALDEEQVGGTCEYAGPCAIGVCIPKEDRVKFDRHKNGGDTSASDWLRRGNFVIPKDQRDDFLQLQHLHDICIISISGKYHQDKIKSLGDLITQLEGKYLS